MTSWKKLDLTSVRSGSCHTPQLQPSSAFLPPPVLERSKAISLELPDRSVYKDMLQSAWPWTVVLDFSQLLKLGQGNWGFHGLMWYLQEFLE